MCKLLYTSSQVMRFRMRWAGRFPMRGWLLATALLPLSGLLTLPVLGAPPSTKVAAAPAAVADAEVEDEQGFEPLFNGKDLTGWVGDTQGYAVEDAAIVCKHKEGGNLYTEREYANFVLRFEFQFEPGANNGIGLRAPLSGDSAYEGMESQILDDTHENYAGKISDYQHHGSIYGILPAKPGHLKPAGEWNEEEITLNGRDVKVVLNGHVIVEGNLDEASKNGTVDGREHPGLARKSGHIGFLGHGYRVAYRKLRVKVLE